MSVGAPIAHLRASSRVETRRRAIRHAVFIVVPACVTAYICWFVATHHQFAVDFDHAFWPAGRKVLDGLSPYVGASSPLAKSGVAFVYPAPGALFFAAFAWMPHPLAGILFTALSVAAAMAALWILDVRDWRVYGLLLLWPPVIAAWQTANVSLLIAFGVGVAWRFRDRPMISGISVGLLVAIKLFMWPLGLWLLATRRYRGLAWSGASAVVTNVAAWAVVGFGQVHAYMALARAVTAVEERTAYTPVALATHLGASLGPARLVGLAIAALAAVYCIRSGRRHRDTASLLGAIALSLLATPVVWTHYFVLLIVPLSIARPRLSALWALPLVIVLCPVTTPATWQLLIALTAVGITLLALVRRPAQSVAAVNAPCVAGWQSRYAALPVQIPQSPLAGSEVQRARLLEWPS